jgi:exodeoxyribonuclease VII small subunit
MTNGTDHEPEPEPTEDFEAALRRLEQIVDDLERGEPDLSAALARYEQGVRLLARCHAVLDRAERSVALLTGVDAAGNPVTAPFDPGAAAPGDDPDGPGPGGRKTGP